MTEEVAQLIRTLERERYEAMLSADLPKLDKLLHPKLICMHSNGDRDDKRSYWIRFVPGISSTILFPTE